MATRAAYHGGHSVNDYSWIVGEFNQRKRLAELGFTSSVTELPAWKADAFGLIDAEIHKLQEAEMKKKSRGRK